MIIKPPFYIGSRLAPALTLPGHFTLSLIELFISDGGRHGAEFVIDFPDGTSYVDRSLLSAVGGFRGYVDVFETYLNFMESFAEAVDYKTQTGRESDCYGIFPDWVAPHLGALATRSGCSWRASASKRGTPRERASPTRA